MIKVDRPVGFFDKCSCKKGKITKSLTFYVKPGGCVHKIQIQIDKAGLSLSWFSKTLNKNSTQYYKKRTFNQNLFETIKPMVSALSVLDCDHFTTVKQNK